MAAAKGSKQLQPPAAQAAEAPLLPLQPLQECNLTGTSTPAGTASPDGSCIRPANMAASSDPVAPAQGSW